jgi:LPS-assembly lipoprotein
MIENSMHEAPARQTLACGEFRGTVGRKSNRLCATGRGPVLTPLLDMQCKDMASSPMIFGRRFFLGAVFGFGTAMVVSACGFRPLYGARGAAAGPEVLNALAATAVRPISERAGQRLRQILNEKLHSNGPAAQSRYDLDVVLTKQIIELGVRPDSTTSRANLIMSARLTLYDQGAQAFVDGTQAVVSYNILDDQFASVSSQADAEDRALKQLGDDIKTRLAVYFDRRLIPMQAAARR